MPKKDLGSKASDPDSAMDSLVRLLAARERSEQEAHKRLTEKGYNPQSSSCAIKRALACGLLDDQRFARGFIKDKHAKGWGRYRIEQELYRFGIAKEGVEGYPDEFFSEEAELEQALLLLRQHHSRSKNPHQAAYRYLTAKGYSPTTATSAIKTLREERGHVYISKPTIKMSQGVIP